MNKASIRQLRTEFPKVRAMIAREGEVVVTERGRPTFVMSLYSYSKPRYEKRKAKEEPFDYCARLLKRMPKPISAEASKWIDEHR